MSRRVQTKSFAIAADHVEARALLHVPRDSTAFSWCQLSSGKSRNAWSGRSHQYESSDPGDDDSRGRPGNPDVA